MHRLVAREKHLRYVDTDYCRTGWSGGAHMLDAAPARYRQSVSSLASAPGRTSTPPFCSGAAHAERARRAKRRAKARVVIIARSTLRARRALDAKDAKDANVAPALS